MTERSLRVLYSLGLGIIIALFVGLAIATFYTAPVYPGYSEEASTAARLAATDAYDSATKDYNRNVTVVALVSALLVLGASIWSESRKPLFAGGFLIGGLLTLVYGLICGLTSGVPAVAFFSVAVGLVVVIYLGHKRFFSARAVDARARAREKDRAAYAPMSMHGPYVQAPQNQQPQAPAGFPYTPAQSYQQAAPTYPRQEQYPAQMQPMQQPYPQHEGHYPPSPGAQ